MQTIYLDISKKQLIPTLYAKQGDVGRKFKAVITNNGVADIQTRYYQFSAGYDGASGSGHYTHIDGRRAFETNETNEVVVELAPNMFQAHGDSLFCLTLENKDGAIISLWNIPVSVEKTPGFLSDEIENYYPELHAVLYTEQRLTDPEARQARKNIGAVSADDLHTFDDSIRDLNESVSRTVKFTEQTLTEEQQQTARKNINALKVPQKEIVSKTIQTDLVLSDFGSLELEETGVVERDVFITPRLEFLNDIDDFDFDVEISKDGEHYNLTKEDCTVSEAEVSGQLQWRISNSAFSGYVFTINQFDSATNIILNYNPDDFNLKLYEVQREFVDAPVVTSVNNLPPDENGNLEIPAVLYEQQELTEKQKTCVLQNIGAVPKGVYVKADEEQKLTLTQMSTARYNIDAAGNGQVVRVDQAQNLSEKQKAQARENIGVTPGGDINVDLTGYVKDTDYATADKAGVVKAGMGLSMINGAIQVEYANQKQIEGKSSYRNPITPVNLDLAVKTGITTNQIPLTDEEKQAAKNWLGVVDDGGGGEWESYKTIMVDEEAHWAIGSVVAAQQETNEFASKKYKEVLVRIEHKPPTTGASANLYVAVNNDAGGQVGQLATVLSSTGSATLFLHIVRTGKDWAKVSAGQTGLYSTRSGIVFCPIRNTADYKPTYISYIRISQPVGVGSVFTIWGRR